MENEVKSGQEILDDFFEEIVKNEAFDKKLAESLAELFRQGKLSETNLKHELQKLRDNERDQNKEAGN